MLRFFALDYSPLHSTSDTDLTVVTNLSRRAGRTVPFSTITAN